MYSGSDSTESQNFSQWALNPSAYQNMANDQVDWAALAQQWIIMKEAGPPPIPGEQPILLNKGKKEKSPEGGEAPMEMENDKEDPPVWPGPPQVSASEWNWSSQNQNWGWNNTWTPPSNVPPPPSIMKAPLLPTPNNFNQYNVPPDSTSDNAVSFGNTNQNNDYSPVYWTNNKVVKPHNRRYSKVNVSRPIPPPAPSVSDIPVTPATLDAAKRKQLPAWIREGLEKMERDKLKQQEKEREKQEREIYNEKMKQSEKEKMEILKSTMKEQQKSKFESDGEYSDDDSKDIKAAPKTAAVPLTQEEIMLKVRRMMTEVLLKVTTTHIETICREEYQRYIKKLKASDHRTSAPSGANISAKLGLGIYGEGSGSSSEDSEDEYLKEKRDSDTELKEIIKKKMSDFTRTEREIEDKLAEAEKRKEGNGSRDSSPDSNDNDSQVDARLQGRRNRSAEDSSPPNNKVKRTTSSSSDSDSYSNNKSKPSRRSSSSDSVQSSKRTRRKYSRSRSRSSSKKYKSHSDKYSSSVRSNSSKSPSRKRRSRSDSRDRRNTNGSRKRYSRSRSRSYSSRSRRSRSSSYKRSKRSYSRERSKRNSRSNSRSHKYNKSRRSRSRSHQRSNKRRRSRSSSNGRGKRSHRY